MKNVTRFELNINLNFITKKSLESSGQIERAACLAFLTQHYEQALEILDNSSKTG